MYADFLKEYRSRKEKYLRAHLNDYFVLFKFYFSEGQVNYYLYKRKIPTKIKHSQSPPEKLVNDFDREFDNINPIAIGAFYFRENESVYIGNVEVYKNFRRNYIALFMLKHFLQDYYPNNEYIVIKAEARTEESKNMCQKLGFEIERIDREFNYWYMILKPPKKIIFPKECCLEIITEKTTIIPPP